MVRNRTGVTPFHFDLQAILTHFFTVFVPETSNETGINLTEVGMWRSLECSRLSVMKVEENSLIDIVIYNAKCKT